MVQSDCWEMVASAILLRARTHHTRFRIIARAIHGGEAEGERPGGQDGQVQARARPGLRASSGEFLPRRI